MVLVNGDRRSSRCVIEPAPAGRAWHLVADTAAAPPADWTPLEQARPLADRHMLPIAERALVVLATR
jgi:hypothetical protein